MTRIIPLTYHKRASERGGLEAKASWHQLLASFYWRAAQSTRSARMWQYNKSLAAYQSAQARRALWLLLEKNK